jgi:S-adenosylmethionine:tRNA-ribosyltransferase-isomerase (queuine synthetase)
MMVYEEFRKIDRIGRNSIQNTSTEVTPEDADRYQTIYAKKAVAAPPQDCTSRNIC